MNDFEGLSATENGFKPQTKSNPNAIFADLGSRRGGLSARNSQNSGRFEGFRGSAGYSGDHSLKLSELAAELSGLPVVDKPVCYEGNSKGVDGFGKLKGVRVDVNGGVDGFRKAKGVRVCENCGLSESVAKLSDFPVFDKSAYGEDGAKGMRMDENGGVDGVRDGFGKVKGVRGFRNGGVVHRSRKAKGVGMDDNGGVYGDLDGFRRAKGMRVCVNGGIDSVRDGFQKAKAVRVCENGGIDGVRDGFRKPKAVRVPENSGFDGLLDGLGKAKGMRMYENGGVDYFLDGKMYENGGVDGFLDGFGKVGMESKQSGRRGWRNDQEGMLDVDDLGPRFRRSVSLNSEASWPREPAARKASISEKSSQSPHGHSKDNIYVGNGLESCQALFGRPSLLTDSYKYVGQTFSPPFSDKATSYGVKDPYDTIWLTITEVPLYTQPTAAPPPSRPPPPIPSRKKVNEFNSSQSSAASFQSPRSMTTAASRSFQSSFHNLEEHSVDTSQNTVEYANVSSTHNLVRRSVATASAAAINEAMDHAKAKFRHVRKARVQENTSVFRNKETMQEEKYEKTIGDAQERALREKQERLDPLQKERERWEPKRLEREIKQAVERAMQEARERTAAEALLKAERAAVEKAAAEARVRAEGAAVQRSQADSCARAAAKAKERTEKAAAKAREKELASAEAREWERERERAEVHIRVGLVAMERATAEGQQRAAADTQERVAAATEANQQKNENDLNSFSSKGRESSSPRPSSKSSNRRRPESAKTSARISAKIGKASLPTNTVDELIPIYRAASSLGELQEIEGENKERRRARTERHQRTQARVAKALAEKNQRDIQVQREQAEKHRIAETLDDEIKHWAAGKEGNLRALLSTLHFVLWPECGWLSVSLIDLFTAAAVKKAYRKATLCIHPDKVQQKGANLQQKYIAEKVFYILKEAWSKFNSEEHI